MYDYPIIYYDIVSRDTECVCTQGVRAPADYHRHRKSVSPPQRQRGTQGQRIRTYTHARRYRVPRHRAVEHTLQRPRAHRHGVQGEGAAEAGDEDRGEKGNADMAILAHDWSDVPCYCNTD